LGEVFLGEIGERDAHTPCGVASRSAPAESFARVVGAGVSAALNPSRAGSVEAVAIGPQGLPIRVLWT
jgi:hypothetical protein